MYDTLNENEKKHLIKRKLIMVIDNFHLADKKSVGQIINILADSTEVLFVPLLRNREINKLNYLIKSLGREKVRLTTKAIQLKNLDVKSCNALAKAINVKKYLNLRKVIGISGGIPDLLVNLTSYAEINDVNDSNILDNYLNSILAELPENARIILEMASALNRSFSPFKLLECLSINTKYFYIIRILTKKNLLKYTNTKKGIKSKIHNRVIRNSIIKNMKKDSLKNYIMLKKDFRL